MEDSTKNVPTRRHEGLSDVTGLAERRRIVALHATRAESVLESLVADCRPLLAEFVETESRSVRSSIATRLRAAAAVATGAVRELGAERAGTSDPFAQHTLRVVTHDLNNALMPLVGWTELLDDGNDVDGVREAVLAVTASLDYAEGLGLRMSLLRPRLGAGTTPDLAALLDRKRTLLTGVLEHAADRRVALRLDVPHHVSLPVPPRTLLGMLLALLENARDTMKSGGTCTLEAEASGRGVLMRVDDDGPHLDPAVMDRAFEPFFGTKPGAFLGLGLTVTREVTEAAGGTVLIGARPGAPGARIVLEFGNDRTA